MPVYAGVKSDIITGVAVDSLTSDNLAIARDYYMGDVLPAGRNASMVAGTHTPSVVVDPHANVYAGSRSTDFGGLWYYRFHVIPAELVLGNLLTTQNRTVTVWNAYFTSKSMTAASIPITPGLSLSLPVGVVLPYPVKPLEEVVLTVQATLSGPPTISSALTIVIDGQTFVIPITGRRIILFPFPPNWKTPFDETFDYKSWVLPAADGSEQTGSVWGNRPRRRFDYAITLVGKQSQRLENMLFGWQSRFFGLSHWAEMSKLTAEAPINSSTIYLDTVGKSYEVGGLVTLFLSPDVNESREILSMTTTSITVTTPFLLAWPLRSRVYPCFVASINATLSGNRLTDDKIQMPVSFLCEPSVTPSNTAPGVAPLTYSGEELYLGNRLNWKSSLPFEFNSDRQDIDMQTGKIMMHSPAGYTNPQRQHNWQIRNATERSAFLSWMGRRLGRARPMYAPTWNSDFTLVAPIVNPSASLDVMENEYGNLAALHPARRDVIVLARDGTHYARRVTGIVDLGGGLTRLLLDSPITVSLALTAVKRVCLLQLYRQVSDSSTIRWLTDTVGTVESKIIVKRTPES